MLNEDSLGLTSEERESLTPWPKEEQAMSIKMSLLAFASLLLICAMIVAASLMVELSRPNESTRSIQPDRTPPRTQMHNPQQ